MDDLRMQRMPSIACRSPLHVASVVGVGGRGGHVGAGGTEKRKETRTTLHSPPLIPARSTTPSSSTSLDPYPRCSAPCRQRARGRSARARVGPSTRNREKHDSRIRLRYCCSVFLSLSLCTCSPPHTHTPSATYFPPSVLAWPCPKSSSLTMTPRGIA